MDTPHAQYDIIKQEKTSEITPEGQMADVWKVTYRTPSGTVSYIRIPASEYTAQNVAADILHEMSHIEEVHAAGRPATGQARGY